MPTSQESPFSANTPPMIFEPEMSRQSLSSTDLEFFDTTSFQHDATAISDGLLGEGLTAGAPHFVQDFGPTDHIRDCKAPRLDRATLLDSRLPQPEPARSSSSPSGSFRDSASDSSRYKRKSSSDSSHSSAVNLGEGAGSTGMDKNWTVESIMRQGGNHQTLGNVDGTMNPVDMNMDCGDTSIYRSFGFDGTTTINSPQEEILENCPYPEPSVTQQQLPRKKISPVSRATPKSHSKQLSMTQGMKDLSTAASREASPLSAVIFSQEASPGETFTTSPSPELPEIRDRQVPNSAHWPHPNPHTSMNPFQQMMYPAPPYVPVPLSNHSRSMMILHPTPFKSRVETQINIKLTLCPLPPAIARLHLPTYSIAKPKLMAKPTPERSPDLLELTTMLVCTSAMQSPEHRCRALMKAAAIEPGPRVLPDEEYAEKPHDGGEVRICQGCIQREKKRASRKKTKKPDEEMEWLKYEAQRVVVFNTHEVKEWQHPTSQPPSKETGYHPEPMIPEGSMQVDAAMRIACYCRHQNEKLGFQVIFTIKDWQNRVVAQGLSPSIMITDDHKTHNGPPLSSEHTSGNHGQTYAAPFTNEVSYNMAGPVNLESHSLHAQYSNPDLRSMQQLQMQYQDMPPRNTQPHFPLQFVPPRTCAPVKQPLREAPGSMTPRTMSRQGSPSLSNGPTAKKRRASGSPKVSSDLAMTRLDTNQTGRSSSILATPSSAQSPFGQNFIDLSPLNEPRMSSHVPPGLRTGPPTPTNDQSLFSNANRSQSMENLAMHRLYSAPASTHHSRAPSPNRLRSTMQNFQQQTQIAHAAQAIANNLLGIPGGLATQNPPTINKLIPNEGPKSGGIEVTILGSGFYPGIEIMFGAVKATTTTYWGEQSLVCLLPPSPFAGSVPVTFKHHRQPPPFSVPIPTAAKPSTYFKYVDDDELELLKSALMVLGRKMTGQIEDVRDLAMRITRNNSHASLEDLGASSSSGVQNTSGFHSAAPGMGLEQTVLKCLELIDLDDGPYLPRFNLKRRASRHTMLHLACSLGLRRIVAGILARGAYPDPRDRGGFTPLHFAALHNHSAIVKRLILHGADPEMRSLKGYFPCHMTRSREVLLALNSRLTDYKRRSNGSAYSRASSATSLRSLWGSEVSCCPPHVVHNDEDDGDDANVIDQGYWMRTLPPSTQQGLSESPKLGLNPMLKISDIVPAANITSPTAAMLAFRDHITTQIHHLQQVLHVTLPTLPQMPQMPSLPDYQAYLPNAPMVRRISCLVGNGPNSPPPTSRKDPKDPDAKWWDLFSSSPSGVASACPPPAYDDIFPSSESRSDTNGSLGLKDTTATTTAADAVAERTDVGMYNRPNLHPNNELGVLRKAKENEVVLRKMMIGRRNSGVSREQQEHLRRAHAEKLRVGEGDRKLFFIWIPLLIIIVLAMLYNRRPRAWNDAMNLFESIQACGAAIKQKTVGVA